MATDIVIRTGWDRVRYAVLFELLLVLLLAVTMGLMFDKNFVDMGLFSLALSLIALIVNVFYNLAFDFFDLRNGRVPTERSPGWRIVHALGFESTLVVVELPLFMWVMGWGAGQALAFTVTAMAAVVAYTYVFTLVYDRLFPVEQPGRGPVSR